MKVQQRGRSYDVVIVGSPNVNPGYRLLGDPKYPQMAADYQREFRILKQLHCDIFLGAHGAYFTSKRNTLAWGTAGSIQSSTLPACGVR